MKLINGKIVLNEFGAPGPVELEAWCKENGFEGVLPTQDNKQDSGIGMPSDTVLASALWHAKDRHPDAELLDVCSFGGLVSYLATGWYGGFGTDYYVKERLAENIVTALAGGVPAEPDGFASLMPESRLTGEPSEAFTTLVLKFLERFYFEDQVAAVQDLIGLDEDGAISAQVILALAGDVAEYEKLASVADGFLKKKKPISSLREAVKEVLGATSK